jgi:hypothetical protein
VLLVSCGSDDSASTTPPAPTAEPSQTDQTTTQPLITTVPTLPPNTQPESTPAQPPATQTPDESLELRADGLGTVDFGASVEDSIAAVTEQRDEPTSDQTDHWVNGVPVMPAGQTSMATRSESWNQPVSRVVCWRTGSDEDLCLFFGGPDDHDVTFVGWSTFEGSPLSMSDGLASGSHVSDFPDIVPTLTPESCTDAWGTHLGVTLSVEATDVPFAVVDTLGNSTRLSPDPSTLEVRSLRAGYVGDNDEQVCSR